MDNKIERVKEVLDEELKGVAVDINSDGNDVAREIAEQAASVNLDELIPRNVPNINDSDSDSVDSTEEKTSFNDFVNNEDLKEDSDKNIKEVNTEDEVAAIGQFSKATGDIVSVFGRRIKEIRQMDFIKNSGNILDNEIRLMSRDIIKTETGITSDEAKYVIKLMGDKNPAVMTEEEINELITKAGLHFKENIQLNEGYNLIDAKRMFLDSLKIYDEQYKEIDKAEKEFNNIHDELINSFDELLSNVDLLKELEAVQKQIDECTNEKEKIELQGIYRGIYSIININRYFDKLNLKPVKILKKEARKDFDHISKKALLALKNDKENTYLGEIVYVQSVLDRIFPDLKEANKIFVYVLNKKILKNKTKKDPSFPSFLNYLILTLRKLDSEVFKDDSKYTEMKNNIREAVEIFK